MSVYVFKWDAWVAKRKDAGRFTIIYDELLAQVDRRNYSGPCMDDRGSILRENGSVVQHAW